MTGWRWPAARRDRRPWSPRVLAGCGSTRGQAARAGPAGRHPSLATSAGYPDGTWAVLVMGGAAAQHNDFWQLFVRPSGDERPGGWPPRWAWPATAASRSAATGGPSLVAALLPSQDLRFSPLARSTDNGAKWSARTACSTPPLAGYPARWPPGRTARSSR